jgi:hypothetical protein
MKVRLKAEEYFVYAPLCARTPTRRADLLRRRLRLPLASSTRNGPRDSLRLRREPVQPVVACAEPAGPGGCPARAARGSGAALGSEGSFVRSKQGTCLRSRSAARGEREDSCFRVWRYEAAGSIAAAQELTAPAAPELTAVAATEPAGAPFTTEPAASVPASAPGAGRQCRS